MASRRDRIIVLALLAALAGAGPGDDPKDEKGPSCCADGGPSAPRHARTAARYTAPDVPLRDHRGRATSFPAAIDHDGPVVMQFVFTTCPTICPAMSGAMAAFQEKLGADARGVRMVSISIDPEHDRPGRLLAYAKSLGAGPQWSFYTGRAKDIAAIQRAFDADAANKMWHRPLTFIRPRKGATWTRLEGLPGGAELLDEYRRAVRP